MTTGRRLIPIAVALGLLTTLSIPPETGAQSSPRLPPDNPLQRLRDGRATRLPAADVVRGEVVETARSAITVGFVRRLDEAGVDDQDVVTVGIAGQMLLARVVTAATYDQLIADARAFTTIDVDVLVVCDGGTAAVVVGLSSDLAAWLSPPPGSPVTLRAGAPR